MHRKGQALNSPRPQALGVGARLLLVLSLLPLPLVGCQGKNRIKDKDDPLINGAPIPAKGATTKAKSSDASVPPVPVYSSAGARSNAYLTVGGRLEGTRELNIPAPQNSAGGWQGQTTPTGDNPGAVLRRPEPIVEPVPRVERPPATGVVPSSHNASAPPPPSTTDRLRADLRQRGLLWDHEEKTLQGVRYFAAFNNPATPDQPRILEVTAPTLEQAMQLVLK